LSSYAPGAITAFQRLPPEPHVMTVGNFDGVHRGHQYLIARVMDDARRRVNRSLIVTFEPHPTSVLRPNLPFQRLTVPERKLALLRATGVDDVVVIPFDDAFAALEPHEFLTLVTESARPAAVFVGEGFRFGRGRSGDGETIATFGNEHSFTTTIIERLRDDGAMISSSSVRDALHTGDIERANGYLGRRYRLGGVVEHGAARGRELGFPTANLLLPPSCCVPCDGIYAAYAHVSSSGFGPQEAMVYIGTRPTFEGGDRIVEVNLLDFSGDLYTRYLDIEFVAFVRGDARFDSAAALAEQMHLDDRNTRVILAATHAELTTQST